MLLKCSKDVLKLFWKYSESVLKISSTHASLISPLRRIEKNLPQRFSPLYSFHSWYYQLTVLVETFSDERHFSQCTQKRLLCDFVHTVLFNTECVILHTVCNSTHTHSFYTPRKKFRYSVYNYTILYLAQLNRHCVFLAACPLGLLYLALCALRPLVTPCGDWIVC